MKKHEEKEGLEEKKGSYLHRLTTKSVRGTVVDAQ